MHIRRLWPGTTYSYEGAALLTPYNQMMHSFRSRKYPTLGSVASRATSPKGILYEEASPNGHKGRLCPDTYRVINPTRLPRVHTQLTIVASPKKSEFSRRNNKSGRRHEGPFMPIRKVDNSKANIEFYLRRFANCKGPFCPLELFSYPQGTAARCNMRYRKTTSLSSA